MTNPTTTTTAAEITNMGEFTTKMFGQIKIERLSALCDTYYVNGQPRTLAQAVEAVEAQAVEVVEVTRDHSDWAAFNAAASTGYRFGSR